MALLFFPYYRFFFSLFQPVPHLSHSTIYNLHFLNLHSHFINPPFSNFSFYPILYFPSLFVFSLFMSKPSSIPRVFPPNAEFETTMGPNGRDLIFFSPACVPLTFRVPRSACRVSRVTCHVSRVALRVLHLIFHIKTSFKQTTTHHP